MAQQMSTRTKLQITQAGANAASAGLNFYSNKRQGDRLASATERGYKIGRQNYSRQVNQGQLQIESLNTETVGARNDRLGQYREQMGALRVALAEQGASGSSAFSQEREVSAAAGTDISRLQANNRRQASAITNSLFDARSGLQIANQQAYENAQAQASALQMNTIGGFVQAAAGAGKAFSAGGG